MPQPQQPSGTYGYQQPYNPYMTSGNKPLQSGSQYPYQQQAYPGPITQQPHQPQYQQQPAPQLQVPPMQVPTPRMEQSYIENIFRLNRGKMATVYMTFENNSEWNAKIFKGIVEAAGRDHIVLSDPTTGMRFVLPMINFDYATFDEELEYHYPQTLPGR